MSEDKFMDVYRKAIDSIDIDLGENLSDYLNCAGCIIGLAQPKYVERKARPMQEICKQAELEKDRVWELLKLRAEILLDQDQFTKSHFDFMQEMIQEFIDKYNQKNTYTGTYYNPNYED